MTAKRHHVTLTEVEREPPAVLPSRVKTDVLEVCCRPYDPKRPLICLGETLKQLIGQAREPLPARPSAAERHDHVYVRNGMASMFLACEPLAGWRQCLARRIANHDTLPRQIARREQQRYAVQAKVNWHLTTNQARNKLCSLCPSYHE